MKKLKLILFVSVLLCASSASADVYSYNKYSILEVDIPNEYVRITEENKNISSIAAMLYANIGKNMDQTASVIIDVFLNDSDSSFITIESAIKPQDVPTGFLLDMVTDEEVGKLGQQFSNLYGVPIAVSTIDEHKYFEFTMGEGAVECFTYATVLNGYPITYRFYRYNNAINNSDKAFLYNIVNSATYEADTPNSDFKNTVSSVEVQPAKGEPTNFLSSIWNTLRRFIERYIGYSIADSIIGAALLAAVGAVVGIVALVKKIFSPKHSPKHKKRRK